MAVGINQPLTERQITVLQDIADGETPEEIADRLFISRQGVYTTLQDTKKKLRATSTPSAVAQAFRKKLIR